MDKVIVNGVNVTESLANYARIVERLGHVGGMIANELYRMRFRMTAEEQAHTKQLIADWEALFKVQK